MILACQKLLGQITKVLGLRRPHPPYVGKNSQIITYFFSEAFPYGELVIWRPFHLTVSLMSFISHFSSDMDKKALLREKITTREEAYKNMQQARKFSTEELQAKIKNPDMETFLNDISSDRLSQSAVLVSRFVPKFCTRSMLRFLQQKCWYIIFRCAVIISICHHVIISTCQHVNMSTCHHVIMSSFQDVNNFVEP